MAVAASGCHEADRIQDGQINPFFVIMHTVPPGKGPAMSKTFRDKEEGGIKVALKP